MKRVIFLMGMCVFWLASNVSAQAEIRPQDARVDCPLKERAIGAREILGREISDPVVRRQLSCLGKASQVHEFNDSLYFLYSDFGGEGIDVEVIKPSMTVGAVFFYVKNTEHSTYKGQLPLGLSLNDGRAEVLQKLGAPYKSGGEHIINYWDAFFVKDFKLQAEYGKFKDDYDTNSLNYVSIFLN